MTTPISGSRAQFQVQTPDLGALEGAKPAAKGTAASRPALTITSSGSADTSLEIADASLTRDDTLGKLVSAAFNLPPPPMPDFS